MERLQEESISTLHTKNKKTKIFIGIFIAGLIPVPALATNDSSLKFSAGFDYSTGSYGLSKDTDIRYIPLSLKYQTFPWTVKLTVPYVHITGPRGVVAGVDGPIIINSNGTKITTAEGLGDVVISAGYALDSLFQSSLLLDFTAKAKIGTADETKGLGTGENDYSLQLDVAKSYGKTTPFITLGHKVIGEPNGIELNNVWYSSIGMDYKINPTLSNGVSYDFKEASSSTSEDAREGLVYLNKKLNSTTSLMGYGVAGFSNASPDKAIGMQMTFKY
ncbi:MAG: Unknown protein [uncultured Thiotrichaceae bacterium]|uniref:Transporter n=1 Tax=uncultured Thiotrichaceae bacterium TaxID=298394 RepID=A0A6S6TZ76_9GAMM|nr:MAG: Unknown protein [uncultured Thiotrichaceae bacterium]